MQMIKWVYDNKDWVFSGIGILLITTVAAIIKKYCHRRKMKWTEESSVTNNMTILGGSNNKQIGSIGSVNIVNQSHEEPQVIQKQTINNTIYDAE